MWPSAIRAGTRDGRVPRRSTTLPTLNLARVNRSPSESAGRTLVVPGGRQDAATAAPSVCRRNRGGSPWSGGLADPAAHRLDADVEVGRDLGVRQVATAGHAHDITLELLRELLGHGDILPAGLRPQNECQPNLQQTPTSRTGRPSTTGSPRYTRPRHCQRRCSGRSCLPPPTSHEAAEPGGVPGAQAGGPTLPVTRHVWDFPLLPWLGGCLPRPAADGVLLHAVLPRQQACCSWDQHCQRGDVRCRTS